MFVLRGLNKHMKAVHPSTTSRLVFLLKGMFGKADWKLRFNQRVMNRAARLAKANARSVRWLLHAGLLIYGKKIQNKQFFLRRITYLSLRLYGLIAVLAKIDARKKMGRDVSEDLRVLSYFLEVARQSRKSDKRLFSSRKEALHKNVVKGIIS